MSNEVSRSHVSTSPEMQEARDAMDAWIEEDARETASSNTQTYKLGINDLAVQVGLRNLVDRFAKALYEKLLVAEKKYNHGDNWKNDDWKESCLRQLCAHIDKGDPLDVAAYCAFAWFHKWSLRQDAQTLSETKSRLSD